MLVGSSQTGNWKVASLQRIDQKRGLCSKMGTKIRRGCVVIGAGLAWILMPVLSEY